MDGPGFSVAVHGKAFLTERMYQQRRSGQLEPHVFGLLHY
jgi:hypothetical protein